MIALALLLVAPAPAVRVELTDVCRTARHYAVWVDGEPVGELVVRLSPPWGPVPGDKLPVLAEFVPVAEGDWDRHYKWLPGWPDGPEVREVAGWMSAEHLKERRRLPSKQ